MNYPIKHTHDERQNLSQELLLKLQNKYKEELLAVALFGSMSRNEDKDYSDIDMIAVVKGDNIADEMQGIQQGLKYGVDIFSQDVIHGKITTISMRWPLLVGKFVTAKAIHDESKLFESYKQLFNETINKDFSQYIKQVFIEEIYEECNKFINTVLYGSREQVAYNAYHLFTKMIPFLGIINKSFYLNTITAPEKAINLPINFSSFKKLGENILLNKNLNTKELHSIVQDMLNEIVDYLRSNDISFEE